jgi:hypothetical protein
MLGRLVHSTDDTQAIAIFKEITDHAFENEKTGTSRYVTLVPTDESNTTSLYMLEQYVLRP